MVAFSDYLWNMCTRSTSASQPDTLLPSRVVYSCLLLPRFQLESLYFEFVLFFLGG
jgi:hypothetical protein